MKCSPGERVFDKTSATFMFAVVSIDLGDSSKDGLQGLLRRGQRREEGCVVRWRKEEACLGSDTDDWQGGSGR